MDRDYINDIFTHHPPKDESVIEKHEEVRLLLKHAALSLDSIVPDSPEKTLAIRNLQQAMMYSNAAIGIYS